MKNFILIFAFLFCATSATIAVEIPYEGSLIEFNLDKSDGTGKIEQPRTPVRPPVVYQNEETLYFMVECENSIVEILNENKETIYNTVVTDVPESLTLPDVFSGTYEIRIIRGDITFIGYIEL